MTYQGERILVTGATGFIGGRLVERLVVEEGAEVRVLVRNLSRASWLARVPVEFAAGDVTDPASLAAAVRGCRRVFHCASGGSNDADFRQTNVTGTQNLVDAARRGGVERFIFISSIAVHGARLPEYVDEQTPLVMTGRGYADSKIEAERFLKSAWETDRFPVTVVRPTYVWGPRSNQFTAGPLVSIKNRTFRLIDGGEPLCPAVYVENLIDLLLLAGARQEAIGEVFLATDGQNCSWRRLFEGYAQMLNGASLSSLSSHSMLTRGAAELLDRMDTLLERLRPNPAPLWRKVIRRGARIVRTRIAARGVPPSWYLALYSNRSRISIDKARRLLGYSPRVSFEEGMRQTAIWVRDQLGWQLGLVDFHSLHDSPAGALQPAATMTVPPE